MINQQLGSEENRILWLFGTKEYEFKEILAQKRFYTGNRIIPSNRLVIPEQVHQDGIINADHIISYCTGLPNPIHIPDADSVITNEKDWFLCIATADCIPVLAYDNRLKVVAAVHSGRMGTQLNIVGKTIDQIFYTYKSRPQDLHFILGPGISARNYPVSDRIYEEFVEKTQIKQDYPNLDLKKVIKAQINEKEVTHIKNIDICTFSNTNFFSYRRNKTAQRQVSIIGFC